MKKVTVKKKGKENVSVSATVEPVDYDKLAEAIVAAQGKINEKKKHENKSNKRMGARQLLMTWCNGILYAVMYAYVIREIIKMWQKYVSAGKPSLYMCIVYTVGGASLAVLLFLAQKMLKLCTHTAMNDSKEDTITHFNTNIALVALIAAIVALVKG